MTQTQATPHPGAAGLSLTEHTLRNWDDGEIFYRAFLPASSARRALFLFHRGHEHSGRFLDLVPDLAPSDTALFAWDARGHGRSPGQRGYAPSFGAMVMDMDHFVRHLAQTHKIPLENVIVLGHSVAGVVASAWVHDYAPPIRGLILATPAFRVKLYVPFAIPGLRLLLRAKRGRPAFIKSYVRSRLLTHDPTQQKQYDADPLIERSIAVNILLGLHDAATRLLDDAGAIRTPTLVLSAGSDWVVKLSAQYQFFDRLGAATKHMKVFAGMYHDILHETARRTVIDEIRSFLRELDDLPAHAPTLLDADTRGHSHDRFTQLQRRRPLWSPQRWALAAQKTFLNTAGRLSHGIRLGWESGFDSGRTLDYVYENRPRGRTPVGRIIDRAYLNSPGWVGIRQRRLNIQLLLRQAIQLTHAAGRPVRILDVAAGGGRYVLETLHSLPAIPASALLRDFESKNLEHAMALAGQLGLSHVAAEPGDAFDQKSLAGIAPAPTIALASGIYELFDNNEMVLRSLRGIAAAMKGDGYLIYTNQPWHPQVEMIARVLINHRGQPWVMRLRSQEEMDQLAAHAGFAKIDMKIDEAGIFTVSLARLWQTPG